MKCGLVKMKRDWIIANEDVCRFKKDGLRMKVVLIASVLLGFMVNGKEGEEN